MFESSPRLVHAHQGGFLLWGLDSGKQQSEWALIKTATVSSSLEEGGVPLGTRLKSENEKIDVHFSHASNKLM